MFKVLFHHKAESISCNVCRLFLSEVSVLESVRKLGQAPPGNFGYIDRGKNVVSFLFVQVAVPVHVAKVLTYPERVSIAFYLDSNPILFWIFLTLLCDWSRKLAQLSNQSDTKLKPITAWLPLFSRASGSFPVFILSSHWFLKIFSFSDWLL